MALLSSFCSVQRLQAAACPSPFLGWGWELSLLVFLLCFGSSRVSLGTTHGVPAAGALGGDKSPSREPQPPSHPLERPSLHRNNFSPPDRLRWPLDCGWHKQPLLSVAFPFAPLLPPAPHPMNPPGGHRWFRGLDPSWRFGDGRDWPRENELGASERQLQQGVLAGAARFPLWLEGPVLQSAISVLQHNKGRGMCLECHKPSRAAEGHRRGGNTRLSCCRCC